MPDISEEDLQARIEAARQEGRDEIAQQQQENDQWRAISEVREKVDELLIRLPAKVVKEAETETEGDPAGQREQPVQVEVKEVPVEDSHREHHRRRKHPIF